MTGGHALGWVGLAAGVAWAAVELRAQVEERRVLAETLRGIVTDGRIDSLDDLRALWRYLVAHVRWQPARGRRRPLLRTPAASTLRSGIGLCGENARAAVLLLRLGGMRAHRLYLFGPRWGHVVVECLTPDGWRLFDAHADDATLPMAEQIGTLVTTDPARLPNLVAENPWTGAATLKPLRLVNGLARRHPPDALVAFMESPHLVKAGLGVALALLGAGLLAL